MSAGPVGGAFTLFHQWHRQGHEGGGLLPRGSPLLC